MVLGGAPLLTGSALALIAGAALTLLLVVRIVNEEQVLSADLPGYDEYRQRVRYRLVPFVRLVRLIRAAGLLFFDCRLDWLR